MPSLPNGGHNPVRGSPGRVSSKMPGGWIADVVHRKTLQDCSGVLRRGPRAERAVDEGGEEAADEGVPEPDRGGRGLVEEPSRHARDPAPEPLHDAGGEREPAGVHRSAPDAGQIVRGEVVAVAVAGAGEVDTTGEGGREVARTLALRERPVLGVHHDGRRDGVRRELSQRGDDVLDVAEAADADPGYTERWIVHKSPAFSATELVVRPGAAVTLTNTDAYGAIVIQGHGTFGAHDAAASTLIRFGDLTEDEFFVSEEAARRGVRVTNRSTVEPPVLLKHFGPGNAALEALG